MARRPKDKFTKAPRTPTLFDLDILMAARYAYYVKAFSIMSDKQYDDLEALYEITHGAIDSPGSDKAEDYSPAQRALALYFLLSGRAFESLSIL